MGVERRVQREAAVNAVKALDQTFTVNDTELERVEVFKYLGRLMSMDDSDMWAVYYNLNKARKSWRMLSHLVRSENLTPRQSKMFYKAVVQAVLLYGS